MAENRPGDLSRLSVTSVMDSSRVLSCRIIVLNYNRRDLLEKFLPSVVACAKASRHPCRVTVLDNASSDDSVDFVKRRFSEADVVVAGQNKVLCSYNEAVRRFEEEIVILLNNDIQPEKDFVDPLVSIFLEREDAFFAATHGDRSVVAIRWGLVTPDVSHLEGNRLREEPGFAFSAGIAAFDRKKFLELGGFDEMYLPGRYEDVDLCYRGWKKGWRGYYVPQARKFHVGAASFAQTFTPDEIQRMVFRNGILFTVKNITDVALWVRFILMLKLRLLSAALLGKWFILQGFWDALEKLPEALRSRKEVKRQFVLRDREVIGRINHPNGCR